MKQFATLFSFSLIFSLLTCSLSAQDYIMSNTDITDCSGFFLDSGGNGSYGPNEDLTTVICPDLTSGTHIQLVFSGAELAAGDEVCFFDGMDATAPNLACNTDFQPGAPFIIQATAVNTSGCLTVTFNSNGSDEFAGWEADINCIPACQTIQAVISNADPPIMPADTGYIDICPGERIFLDGMGIYPQSGAIYEHSDLTSAFEWDFGDGNFSVGPSVAHTYEEPGGYIIQLKITDQFECESTNFISQRVRVSPYPTFQSGEDLPDEICQGDTVSLNSTVADSTNVYDISATAGTGSFQTEQTRSDSLALPDGTGAVYSTSVSFTDFSPGQVLTNVEDIIGICVNIEHSYLRDLEIKLSCPDGTEIILHDHPGNVGGGVFLGEPIDNDGTNPIPGIGYEYCWTPNAPNPTWIEYVNTNTVSTLPPGDYSTFDPLSTFLGCPLNGEWTISVQDLWGIDNGFIFEWGIEFAADLYPTVESFSPEFVDWGWQENPSIFFSTQDSIAAQPNAGSASYTFETVNSFGCEFDTTFALTVLPPTHPDCYNCADNLRPVADTTICFGELVSFDVEGEIAAENEVTFETVPNYPLGKPNHPPANAYYSEIPINSINPPAIDDPLVDIVSVCVDFETNYNADIQMILVSPSGMEMELSTNNGGSGDNYTNTCFTPTATTPITAGTPPFTGDFQPEGDWNDLIGQSANGTWSLKISDAFGNQMGLLRSWNITFRAENEITYNWTPSTGLSCDDCPNPTATLAQTVNYTVNVSDSYGCDAEDQVEVEVLNEIAAPVVNCNADDDTGIITLTWAQVGSINEYEINTGNGWMPITGTEWSMGGFADGDVLDYEIRAVFNGGNCGVLSTTESCIMVVDCDMTVEAGDGMSSGQVDCNGSCDYFVSVSTFEAANGDIIYSAVNNDTGETVPHPNSSSGAFPGLCPGSYTFTAQDTEGCIASFDYLITSPPPIEATSITPENVSCNGGNDGTATIVATGGTGQLSYLWSDPLNQAGATATFLAANTYFVTVTDENLCEEVFDVEITEPVAIDVATTVTDVLCFGENTGAIDLVVTNGTPPYSFNWQDVDDGLDLAAGTYTVTVVDANDCEVIVTETINQPAEALTVDIEQTFVGCFETNTSIAIATASGGTGNASYLWDNGDDTPDANDLTDGMHSVTVTDENQCETIQTIMIEQLDELVPEIIITPVSCAGNSDGAAGVNLVTGGIGTPVDDLTFSWSSGTNDITATNLPEGPISVEVTDAQGCMGNAASNITGTDAIEALLEAQSPTCAGETTGSATVADVVNGSGNITYQWDAAAGNQTTATAENLAAGTYSVTVSDGDACVTEGTIEVIDPEPLAVEFETVDNECAGDQDGAATAIISGGTGNYAILWENENTSTEITGLYADFWNITILDENLCRLIDSVAINQPLPIEADVTVDDADCFGERNGSITVTPLGGTAPFLYSTDGISYNGSSTQIGLSAGEYDVYVQDANGCTTSFEAFVNEPAAIELFANVLEGDTLYDGDEYVLELGDSVRLDAEAFFNQGAAEFTWIEPYEGTFYYHNENDSTRITTNTQNTLYYDLVVIDTMGCTDEIQIRIRVIKDRLVVVPTGFSPNGDNSNETLRVHGKTGTVIELFEIYDRWGEKVFEARDFPVNSDIVGWDGQFRSKEMPPGVYVWYLEARYIDGNTESFKGNTTLLR